MKTCRVDELFDVRYGVNLELNALKRVHNGINFVARTSRNNGVTAHVSRLPYVSPIPAGTISVACGGSVMESFLQPSPYYSGRDLFFLTAKQPMPDELKLFYCHCLRMNKFKYSYGRQANITLPSIQIPRIEEAMSFVGSVTIEEVCDEMNASIKTEELKDVARATGSMSDVVPLAELFTMKNGVPSNNVSRLGYKKSKNWIPYIRPSYKQSTSIDAYVNRFLFADKDIYPKGTLYVSTDGQGSHTYSYVSASDFVPNSNVTVLLPKRPMTLREKLFYSLCISQNRFKFSYGRKPKGDKLAAILLPRHISEQFNSIPLDNLIKIQS